MSFDLLLTDEAVCLDKQPGDPSAKVVPCTSEKAAFQLVGKGSPISAEDAERFGVKTKKADVTDFTLKLDGSTIARTPEEKAYAMTLPQPGLVAARAEQIRASAAMSVASLTNAEAAKGAKASEEAKKAEAENDKKLKATLADKTLKTKRENKGAKKTTAAPRVRKTTKKEAEKPADNG